MYSRLDRKIEKAVLPWCESNHTGVLVYSPMHSGILTGKVSKKWLDNLPSNDWRKHKTDHPVVSHLYSKDSLQSFLILQEELRVIAEEKKMTVGQLAVSWTLSHSAVTSAIVGARKKGQILETVKAIQFSISASEKSEIMKCIGNYEQKLKNG